MAILFLAGIVVGIFIMLVGLIVIAFQSKENVEEKKFVKRGLLFYVLPFVLICSVLFGFSMYYKYPLSNANMPVQQNLENKQVKNKYIIVLYSEGKAINYWISDEKPREGFITQSISFNVNNKLVNVLGDTVFEEFEPKDIDSVKQRYGLSIENKDKNIENMHQKEQEN